MKIPEAELIVEKHKMDGWVITTDAVGTVGRDPNSYILMSLMIPVRHFIIITPPNKPNYVFTSQMEKPMAEKALKDYAIVDCFSSSQSIQEKIEPVLRKMNKIALNYNEDHLSKPNGLSHTEYLFISKKCAPNAKFYSSKDLIYDLRSTKNEIEIQNHKEAVKITLEVLEQVPEIVKPNMTELGLSAELECQLRKQADDMAFNTIIATAENSADPHYNTSSRKIEQNAPLLIDIGIRRICSTSDITWTYYVGKPSEDFLAVYDTVYTAKELAKAAIKVGIPYRNVALIVDSFFREKGYDPDVQFPHSLGHAIGFETHDIGHGLSKHTEEDKLIPENAVITVEPGLYWQGKWGVRLEDDVVVRKENAECLSNTPKEPLII